MGLTKTERETILRWDEEDRVDSLYSASPAVWRKVARLGLKPVKETRLAGSRAGSSHLPFGGALPAAPRAEDGEGT